MAAERAGAHGSLKQHLNIYQLYTASISTAAQNLSLKSAPVQDLLEVQP